MFRSKKDVDRHVSDILSKIHNENERNQRGYNFARLYYQVKDYDTARKYLAGYLSVRDYHAPSHKLMGQVFEATGNLERALQSYKRSFEIDPNQKDLVLKICDLYCKLPVDHETAKYWADRGDQLFPHSDIVFRLRECIVTADGEPNRQELENLITAELDVQPMNLSLRVKLLRLYLDTERTTEAYEYAMKIERKRPFPSSTEWYYLLVDIFEAYEEEHSQDLSSTYYIHFLTAMDHLLHLLIVEPHALSSDQDSGGLSTSSISNAASVFLTFDQQLKKAVEKNIKSGSWSYFLHHMKGQLYFHLATIILKRAKLDVGNWKEACRFSSALFLVGYTFKPGNLLHEVWFSQLDDQQKMFTNFFQQGSLRTSFIGHLIKELCKEDKGKWLQKIKQDVCLPQVRERIYNRLLSNLNQKKNNTSFFLTDAAFIESSLEFPTEIALVEYDKAVYKLCPDSLHHLVWLNLHHISKEESAHSLYEVFRSLQFSNKNLSKGSPESLCQLDVESYLQATLYTAQICLSHNTTQNSRSEDHPLSVPPGIAEPLCTKEQSQWWRSAYGLVNNTIKEKLGEHRRLLQRGLEVIRGIGNHGLEIQLVVHLARFFAEKATELAKITTPNQKVTSKTKASSDKISSLEYRAIHYWNVALSMLEKLEAKQAIKYPKDQMFLHYNKQLTTEEISSMKEEGDLYIACCLMNNGKLEDAAARLEKLSSPYASFYLALTYKKSAVQDTHSPGTRSALLNKAKDSLYLTMDRVKGNVNHPLNQELHVEIEAVENEISKDISDTFENEEGDSYNDEPDSSYNGAFKTCDSSAFVNFIPKHSTPRPSASFMTPKSKQRPKNEKHLEPSPERLDAQIRVLAMNQSSLIKTLTQQQTVLVDTNKEIVEELRKNREVFEQLKKQLELHIPNFRNHQKTASRRPGAKGQGGEEDKDYNEYDVNGYLDYYVDDNIDEYRSSAYNYEHSSRLATHGDASAMNYVPQAPLPAGPPPPVAHYGYQYPPPHHAALAPPPPGAIPDAHYYHHAALGHALPFSEGQQLPQFRFHVASPMIKPPVPSNIANVPQNIPVTYPPPPSATAFHQIPVSQPNPSWTKAGSVPHAFQIPLPTSTVPLPMSMSASTSGVFSTASPFIQTSSLLSTSLSTVFTPTFTSMTSSDSKLRSLLSNSFTETSPLSAVSTAVSNITTTPTAMTAALFHSVDSASKISEPSHADRSRQDSDACSDTDIEREVMGDFKPAIPLPAEVAVETGEEGEEVLFEDRAKLYRYVEKEWKERGVGTVKLLNHETSGRVRLLMRRDQVLKVCANHCILPTMEIHPMKNSDKAWIWVAQDFADEEVKPEQFCIKFKTSDIADSFQKAFKNAVEIAKEYKLNKDAASSGGRSSLSGNFSNSHSTSAPFSSKFLPKAGSWTCPTCYVSNAPDKETCIACDSEKPAAFVQNKSSFTVSSNLSVDKPDEGSCNFEGKSSVYQSPVISINETLNLSKNTRMQNNAENQRQSSQDAYQGQRIQISSPQTSQIVNKFQSLLTNVSFVSPSTTERGSNEEISVFVKGTEAKEMTTTNKSLFGNCNFIASSVTTEIIDSVSKEAVNDHSVPTNASNNKKDQAKSVFGFTFSSTPVVSESIPEMKDREILVVNTKSKSGPQVTKVESSKPSPFSTFSFKSSAPYTDTFTTHVVCKSEKDSSDSVNEREEKETNPVPVFGSNSNVGNLQFSTFNERKSISTTTSPQVSQGSSLFVTVTKDGRRVSGEHINECAPEDFVPTAEFKPVVPLPALVDIKTGEEEDEKLFGERSKLFRFDSEGKQWKERGIGELKILLLKSLNKYRILMRREQVLKICANHYILPEMSLTPLNTSDRAWVWIAQDFSEGDLQTEQFAAKFKNSEIAQQFYKVFENCKTQLKKSQNKRSETGSVKSQLSDKTKEPLNKDVCSGNQAAFIDAFKSADFWECQNCYVKNESAKMACIACKSPKQINDKNSLVQSFANSKLQNMSGSSVTEQKNIQNNNEAFDFNTKIVNLRSKKETTSDQINLSEKKSGAPTFAELFKPVPGSWECKACYVKNDKNKMSCIACDTPKPGTAPESGAPTFAELFKPVPGSWECKACYVKNDKNKMSCIACETPKPGTAPSVLPSAAKQNLFLDKKTETKTFADLFKPALGTWECEACYVKNDKNEMMCISCKAPKPGTASVTSATPETTVNIFKPPVLSSTSSTANPFVFGNAETVKPASTGFLFGTRETQPSPTFKFGTTGLSTSGFGFKPDSSSSNSNNKNAIFGGASITAENAENSNDNNNETKPTFVFGKGSGTTAFAFGTQEKEGNNSPDESVKFRFGSPQKYEFNFSGITPRSPPKWPKSPRSPGTPSDVDDDEEVEPSDVDNIYFQPVIPLPPKVELKTGEENETPLFSRRAKLFRFIDGEWKERGVGDVKILSSNSPKRIRLLMRRDQVLKVCLNHYVSKDMAFSWKGDKCLTWAAADYSENEPSLEHFAIRFKTPEFALQFKEALDNAIKSLSAPESEFFSPNVELSSNESVELSKSEPKPIFGTPVNSQGVKSTGFVFGSPVPVSKTTSPSSASKLSSFSFSVPGTDSKSSTSPSFSLAARFGVSSCTDPSLVFGNSPPKTDSPNSKSDSDIEIMYQAVPTVEQKTAAEKLLLPPTFYLYENKPPCPGCRGCADAIPENLGINLPEEQKEEVSSPQENQEKTANSVTESDANICSTVTAESVPDSSALFTNTSLSTFSFADLAAKDSGFYALAATTTTSPSKVTFPGTGAPVFGSLNRSNDGEDQDSVVQGPDIHFEPVIPLPDIVDVKTGEEDEESVFCHRAKIYRFDSATGQWKERGVGDFKILKHREQCRFRLLLRRDQVFKVACNHCITPSLEMQPMKTSETSLCWSAVDYSEGYAENSKFAVKFKNKEILEQFQEKFNECKAVLAVRQATAATETPLSSSDVSSASMSNEVGHLSKPSTGDCQSSDVTSTTTVTTTVSYSDGQPNQYTKECDENEQEEDEDDDDDDVIFEKRVTFEIYDDASKSFQPGELGLLQILYDDTVFGFRIRVTSDKSELLCEHIIAIQTSIYSEKKSAAWSAIDISIDPPKRRKFRATFSSVDALNEFQKMFEEGKQAAVEAEIVELSETPFMTPQFSRTIDSTFDKIGK